MDKERNARYAYNCEQIYTFGDEEPEPQAEPEPEVGPYQGDGYEATLMALPGTARYRAIRTSISLTPPEEN